MTVTSADTASGSEGSVLLGRWDCAVCTQPMCLSADGSRGKCSPLTRADHTPPPALYPVV